MMNWFTRFNPFLPLSGAVFTAMAALFAQPAYVEALLVATLLSLLVLGVSLMQRSLLIKQMSNACFHTSQGDMEKRVQLAGVGRRDLLELGNRINCLIDVADAYIRESSASAECAAQGKFYRTISIDGMNGSWGRGAEKLNVSSSQIRQNLINTTQEAGRQLEASVINTISTLDKSIQQLVQTSHGLGNISHQSSEQSTLLSASTTETSQNVSTIAAAVEEMTAAIREIGLQTNYMNGLTQETMAEGHTAQETFKSLAESTAKIGQIAELIKTIATQVNLLALNATIEASRAGEAGKGFAVVASEVKELAKRTSDATSEVDQFIQQIGIAVRQTTDVQNTMLSKVTQISEAASIVAAAVEEQSATTREISSSLQNTSSVVQTFSGSVEMVSATAKHTKESADNMQQSTVALSEICRKLRADVENFLAKLGA